MTISSLKYSRIATISPQLIDFYGRRYKETESLSNSNDESIDAFIESMREDKELPLCFVCVPVVFDLVYNRTAVN